MHCQSDVLQSCHLFPDDCHFSFCPLLTFLWPYGQPSCTKWQRFLFSTSWMLRQLLVLNPASSTLRWPCQHQAHFFIERANRGQSFVEGTCGRSQECETHSCFFDSLLYSQFSASAHPHVQWEVIWGWCAVGRLQFGRFWCNFLFDYFKVKQVWEPISAKKRMKN